MLQEISFYSLIVFNIYTKPVAIKLFATIRWNGDDSL